MEDPENEAVGSMTALTPLTTLGRGSYGKVILCERKKNSDETDLVAVKIIAKARLRSKGHVEKIVTESRVMNGIGMESPFLVGCLGTFQTKNALFFVLPYCCGGELFFHLQKEGKFSENKTRHFAMQICCGIEHLHSSGIVYRDLKPENVLFTQDGRAQLADFGLSKFLPKLEVTRTTSDVATKASSGGGDVKPKKSFFFFRRGSQASASNKEAAGKGESDKQLQNFVWGTTRTRCGTPAYQPPEIVEALEHGLEVDWWSYGVLLYEMLIGEPPFMAEDVKSVYVLIMKGVVSYPKKIPVSDDAKDLISKLLVANRSRRLGYNGASEIKAHPFFDQKKITWEDIETLKSPPALVPEEKGLGNPRDAIFFHAEFTSEDVREYIQPLDKCPAAQQQLTVSQNFIGFVTTAEEDVDKFISSTPLPVIEKGMIDPEDLNKKNNSAASNPKS